MTLVKTAGAAGALPSTSTLAQNVSDPLRAVVSAQAANLFLLEDLDDSKRTRKLAERDLVALRVTANWISTFVGRPHKDLGRAGAVCPYVPAAREHKTIWLAPERIADRSVLDIVQLMSGYKKLFLDAQPIEG